MTTQPRARHTDPATSHAGADAARATASECRGLVLATLLAHPDGLTHEELVQAYRDRGEPPHSESGIRTRCNELVARGVVVDSEERRPSLAGRTSIVWVARGTEHERHATDVILPGPQHIIFHERHADTLVKIHAGFKGAHAGETVGKIRFWGDSKHGKWLYETQAGRQGLAQSRKVAVRRLLGAVYGKAVGW